MQNLTPAQSFFLFTFLTRRVVGKLPAEPSMSAAEWTGVLGESPIETTRDFLKSGLLRRISLPDYLGEVFDYSQIKELAIEKRISLPQGKRESINHLLLNIDHRELWIYILAHHLHEKLDYQGLLAYLNRVESSQLGQWAASIKSPGAIAISNDKKDAVSFLIRYASFLDLWDLVLKGQAEPRHDYSQIRNLLAKHKLPASGTIEELIARLLSQVDHQVLWDIVLDFSYLELTETGTELTASHVLTISANAENEKGIEAWIGLPLRKIKLIVAFAGAAALTGIIGNRADEALSVLIQGVMSVMQISMSRTETHQQQYIGLPSQAPSGTSSTPTASASDPLLTGALLVVLASTNLVMFLKRLFPKHKHH